MISSLVVMISAGCASPTPPVGSLASYPPRLEGEVAVMSDGRRLPLRRWGDPGTPRQVLLGIHGFNDYSNAFAGVGRALATRGILTYAYDQRGFGEHEDRGSWAGTERMAADLREVVALLRQRHPSRRLVLLGESMGAAVVMVAAAAGPLADGYVLLAPAVWSRRTMHPLQRGLLWVAAHTWPQLRLSGRGLELRPSDNLPMLRDYSADPLVIKETRVAALWGVTDLMDAAVAAADRLPQQTLLLYGWRDEIIPRRAFCRAIESLLPDPGRRRLVLYREGWHMLTRDLQGERVLADIAAWIADPAAPLPSGEEFDLRRSRPPFCPVPEEPER